VNKYDFRARAPIATMMDTAVTMYDRRLGATLRQPLIQDARRPMLQKERPRLVLVTDLVDEVVKAKRNF
jgi:hypothetical protein